MQAWIRIAFKLNNMPYWVKKIKHKKTNIMMSLLCIIFKKSYKWIYLQTEVESVQFSHSVVSNSCHPVDCSTPGLPVHHQLLEFIQTHIHWFSDAIQPSHPLSSTSPPALNLSQHQGLFQWVSSSHKVAKVLEFHLQHQSFQWTLRTDLLSDGLVVIRDKDGGR